MILCLAIALFSWNLSMVNQAYATNDSEVSPVELEMDIKRLRSANATLAARVTNRTGSSLEERLRTLPAATGVTIERYDQRLEKTRRNETLLYDVHLSGLYSTILTSLQELENWTDYQVRTLTVSPSQTDTEHVIAKILLTEVD